MCCEFFDYLDEIILFENSSKPSNKFILDDDRNFVLIKNLQQVFITMDRTRSNSMTEDGQCKLAPLMMIIQESNQLYDFVVKFLFKLHDSQ